MPEPVDTILPGPKTAESGEQQGTSQRRHSTHLPGGQPLQSGFFPGLDLLRGFAAISVVIYHVVELFDWQRLSGDILVCRWFRVGWMGVDLFFVISGFVVTLSALKLFERNPAGWRASSRFIT
jgi:peptidoglycan/LPS O-acetylase OafA/YrhL